VSVLWFDGCAAVFVALRRPDKLDARPMTGTPTAA
jgi:hypothetical protein